VAMKHPAADYSLPANFRRPGRQILIHTLR
jgi:hypothetical protein